MTYRDNPKIAKKYKSKRWQKLRKQKLLQDTFCERCLKKGIYISAYFAHHKDYITDENYIVDSIFYNIDNLESLCKQCHNKEHFANKQEYMFDENGDLIRNDK